MKDRIKTGSCLFSFFPFLIAIFFFSMTADAQGTRSKGLVINCDVARFRNTPDQGYLEFYFSFSPRQIVLRQQGKTLSGGVNIMVRLSQVGGSNLVIQRRYFFPVFLTDTARENLNQIMVSQRGFELPFGLYRIQVFASDSLVPLRTDSISMDNIEIAAYGNDPRASDLELCSSIAASQDTAQIFYKNTLQVIPHPSLVFGGINTPVIYHYLELYNLLKDSLYTVETTIFDANGIKKKSTSRQKRYGVRSAVEFGTTTVTTLPSGKYRYQVRILDRAMQEIVSTKKQFFANNPHISTTVSAVSSKGIELLGLSADELANEFRMAQYFATDQEISTFSKISTTDGRREFLAKFWTEVEQGRLGRDPITRIDFLNRVTVASQRYRNISREGWQTDRGRVYLLYSDPDDIQRFPSSDNAKPYEIWEYNQIENGVVFIFVDHSGFGDYLLVHSTKRGELQDEGWERNLH
jgi:GWxTD domain-containing protein